MSDFNRVILTGNLTRDAVTRSLPSGTTVCDFRIASSRKIKDKEVTVFINCCLFGDRANKILPYLLKGKKVLVEGKLRMEEWEKDGVKHSTFSIVVDDLEFISGNRENSKVSNDEVYASESSVDNSFISDDKEVPF